MVITNDSHYLHREDADMHDTLLCLQTNSNKDDPNRFHFSNNEFYVKTKEEMREAFRWMDSEMFEECVQNTEEVANKCDLTIKLHDAPLPHYEVPKGYTIPTYLNHLVMKGIKERYGENPPDAIYERAKYELGVIEQMGFPAYFLITWDFIHFAKTHDIPVGPGRGSAAGSPDMYTLKILRRWNDLIWDPLTGRQGLKVNYVAPTVTVTMHDKANQPFWQWTLYNVFPTKNLPAPDLDYSKKTDLYKVTGYTLRCDYWDEVML